MSNVPNHEFYFSTNRFLWLSLIPKEEREELFPGSTSQIPKRLVTTYVFCGEFWLDPIVNLTATEKKLTAERAWFGIRTFIKGSHIAEYVAREGLSNENFAQLGSDSSIPQVFRSQTDDYFQDDELRTLVSIYNKYSNWLSNKEKYDEMDIVRRALTVSRSRQELWEKGEGNLNVLDETQKLRVVSVLNMSNENVFHKKDAIKAIESKKFTAPVKEKYLKFLKAWVDDEHRRADGVHAKDGIKIYKIRLSPKDRMLFSWVTCSDYNQGKPFLLVYAILFDHDSVNSYLTEKLNATIDDFDTDLENASIEPQEIDSFAQTIGNGPTKPLPGRISQKALDDLDLPHNIALDEHQRRAIVENQPLLIDGLAGTGKTAVLSRRAAFRAGYAKSDSRILMISSNNGVVKRLLQDVSNLARNEQYWKKNKRDFSHALYTIAFQDKEITNSTELQIDDAADYHKFDFDEVLLDECQDVTPLEFEVLKIFVKFNDVRRFSFGGDPLQTLNPTGFDWGRIKSLFVNSIGQHKDESEQSAIAKQIMISKFHQNYRSQGDIVALANAIQRHRSKAVNSDDLIEMIPHHPGSDKPKLVQINPENENDVEAVKKALSESGLGRVTAICWATDDHEVIKLCTGDGSDAILMDVWDGKQKQNAFEQTDFRTALELHSSASIKGGEKHAVLLYKFGTSHGKKLNTLLQDFEDLDAVKQLEKIPVSYAYSRLYVAVTRAFKNVYFLEEKEGIEFWQSVNLFSESGESLFSDKESASEMIAGPDFILDNKLTKDLFKEHLWKWNNNNDKNSLFSAIRIMRHLISEGETDEQDDLTLHELLGDKALHFDDDEDLAITKYKLARKPQKYMPLMFRKKQWKELKERLVNSGDHFHQALALYCDIQMSNNIVESIDLADFVRIIENQQAKLVSHWRAVLVSMDQFISRLKKEFLNKYPRFNSRIEDLLDNYFSFFGWDELLVYMKKVADFNPKKYIEFVDNHQPRGYKIKNDRKYTSSLEKVRDEFSGDERIDFIKNHKMYLDESKQSEWDKAHAKELDLKITKLPEKGFSPLINDNPSFLAKADSNQSSKLFIWLEEIYGLIDQSEFSNDYSRRIESVIQARLEENVLAQFSKLEEALSQNEREGKILNKDGSNYRQLNWIDFTIIANWLNKKRQDKGLLKLNDVEDVTSFLELCLNISKEYSDRGMFKKVEIFNEPLKALDNVSKSTSDEDDEFDTGPKFRVLDILTPRIVGAIKAKRGGDSHKKLIKLIEEVLMNSSLSFSWTKDHINRDIKQIKPKLSKIAQAHYDLLFFRYSKSGLKLEKELQESEAPIKNPMLDKFVELLRKAGHETLAERYEQRKMTTAKEVQREIRNAVSLQSAIDALARGKRGIGDYSFLTLDDFRSLLEKIASDKNPIFEIPGKDETIEKFWNEFLKLNKENEFELTTKLTSGLEAMTYIHAFSFVKPEIMLLCMVRDGMREPASVLQQSFSTAVTTHSQVVSIATGDFAKLTPAKQTKFNTFLKDCEHFEGLKFTDKTKLNDEVVAFLLIQHVSKKEFLLANVKSLCELIGAKKSGKKSELILRLCEELGMTDVENYERLIDLFSRNTI